MSLVVYRKAKQPTVEKKQQTTRSARFRPRITHHSRFVRVLPAVLVTFGSVLIANVVWPIISFQLFISPTLQPKNLTVPVSQEMLAQFQPPPVAAAYAQENTAPKPPEFPEIIPDELDYTNLALWFPSKSIPQVLKEDEKTYTISIPSLDVYDAVVKVGGLNLDKNLIQYPGTANPGELGSPIIFGHSVSPLFYNPSVKNPRRYTSILTKIMSLKKDDKIIVNYDGIQYIYRVTNKMEVKPDDTYILEQRYNVRELKLITCTPPGTYLRRGIVFAQLEDYQ
ncbi:MAG TPA: class E sortase [Patescibacteria group bacterium]|nr:class E sortase [Patescibacteria group bacterium]